MRLVGQERDDVRWMAVERGSDLHLLAPLSDFYADVPRWLAEAVDVSRPARTDDGWLPAAPVLEGAKILCVGLNYHAHAAESAMERPAHPDVFGRWASTLVPDGTPVPVPIGEPGLDWEGELAAIVGQTLYNATPAEVEDAIIGYTVFNDISARTHQLNAGQWMVGKNADNSGPIGPAIVTRDEISNPYELRIQTRLDGEIVQDALASMMIFDIGCVGAYLSECMTLRPGDVIATGTPAGVGAARKPPVYMQPGQLVEVEIDRIGTLSTPIVAVR